LGEGVVKSVENFVNSFAEERLDHDFFSEQRRFPTKVMQMTSKKLHTWMKGSKESFCIIEIKLLKSSE
jgi:hypothetical protein